MPLLKQFNFAAKLYAKLADSLRLFETLAKNYFASHSKAACEVWRMACSVPSVACSVSV